MSAAESVGRVEALRVPASPSAAAHDSKDWYHVVLLNAASGWRAIANVNLAGSGGDAVLEWTLVVHAPGEPSRLYGASRSQPWIPWHGAGTAARDPRCRRLIRVTTVGRLRCTLRRATSICA